MPFIIKSSNGKRTVGLPRDHLTVEDVLNLIKNMTFNLEVKVTDITTSIDPQILKKAVFSEKAATNHKKTEAPESPEPKRTTESKESAEFRTPAAEELPKPAEPQKSAEPRRSAAPQRLAEPQRSAAPQKPTEPQRPSEPQKPTEPQRPAEPQRSLEPQRPAEPQISAELFRPVKPNGAAEPPQATAEPRRLADPPRQVGPHRIVEHLQEPTEPRKTVEPATPVEHSPSAAPPAPVESKKPLEPEMPAKPKKLVESQATSSKPRVLNCGKIAIGSTLETCCISVDETGSQIFAYIAYDDEKLMKIVESISKISDVIEDLSEVKSLNVNDIVFAKSTDDNQWYRSLVEEVTGDKVKIFFFDWGLRESTTLSRIRLLDDPNLGLSNFPACAVKIKFNDISKTLLDQVLKCDTAHRMKVESYDSSNGAYAVKILSDKVVS